jgi:hypothetical protein
VYSVDDRDRVIELDLPQSSVGAPLPIVLADDSTLVVAYFLQEDADPGWDGRTVRIVSHEDVEPAAIVRFDLFERFSFGQPSDDMIFAGVHPLSERGLGAYGAFEVLESSWLRQIAAAGDRDGEERDMTSYRHFIFAFHDNTLECVAPGFEIHLTEGSLEMLLPKMRSLLVRGEL